MRVKGSTFNLGDQEFVINALEVGCSKTASAADNRTALIAAFGDLTATGGIIMIPHGVDHNFVPADFPVTTEALCLWELTGSTFKLITNVTHTTELGEILETLRIVVPKVIKMEFLDVLSVPATYTFSVEVYDNAGSPTIAGSSFDLCFFVPGVADPVVAIARSGSKPGMLWAAAGILAGDDIVTSGDLAAVNLAISGNITGGVDATFSGDVTAHEFIGIKRFSKEIIVPVNAGSTALAATTESVILNHSGTIANYTITLPDNPGDGHRVLGFSRSAITNIVIAAAAGESVAAGHSITTLAANGQFGYMYNSGDTSWYRVQ
jgi:hypothetical protein